MNRIQKLSRQAVLRASHLEKPTQLADRSLRLAAAGPGLSPTDDCPHYPYPETA